MPTNEGEGVGRLRELREEEAARYIPAPLVLPTLDAPPLFYVDACQFQRWGKLWCHLMTTGTEADLTAFAVGLGLKPEWIQKAGTPQVHFDLTEPKRLQAIRAGATATGSASMVRACVWPKRTAATLAETDADEQAVPSLADGFTPENTV